MSKICLALFATVAFLCGFFVQYLGQHDFANSTTREPGPQRMSAAKLLSVKVEEAPEHGQKSPLDAASLARELASVALSLSRKVEEPALEEENPPQEAEENDDNSVIRGTVEKGETLGELLAKSSEDNAGHYLGAAGKVFSPRGLREGQPYAIFVENGRLQRFEYEIDNNKCLIVEGADSPRARIEPIQYDVRLSRAEAAISDSLFQTVADIGESPHLALKLVDLFGSEINFIRDLKEGDSFTALIEKRYRDGEFKGYGRILAARFINRGKTYEAFLFNDGAGNPRYYNRGGENLKKTLLQSPLAFTRITSRFTNSRKHPILGYSRPHLGVDYGAPTGTPVKAVGEGVVTKRGWGGGYGKQIIIRHTAGLESMYAHLSGFARGLKEGARVRQGQVIGYVGSTGLSTGPHLDFRLRQNGKFINPTKAINPRGAAVQAARMARFKKIRETALAWLDGKKSLAGYEPAMFAFQPEKIEQPQTAAAKQPKRIKRSAAAKAAQTAKSARETKKDRASRAERKSGKGRRRG